MPFSQYLSQPPQNTTQAQARQLMHRVLSDASVSDTDIRVLLTVLAARTVTATELADFSDAMRALAIPLDFTAAGA